MALRETLNANFKQLKEENKVNNGYLTGQVSNEKKMFEQVLAMKSSTFDSSKFSTINDVVITDDGIASGFNSTHWNMCHPKNITLQMLKGHSYKILVRCFGIKPHPLNEPRVIIRLSTNINSYKTFGSLMLSSNAFQLFARTGDDETGTTNEQAKITKSISISETSDFVCGFEFEKETGTYYILYGDSLSNVTRIGSWVATTTNKELYYFSTDKINEELTLGQGENNTWQYTGSLDLKQFSVEVDGVEIFNGNKTGIDQIKKDDYEVVGTPTISADGIASGFSSGNYLTIPTFDFDKSWKIEAVFYNGNEQLNTLVICGINTNDWRGQVLYNFGASRIDAWLYDGYSQAVEIHSSLKINNNTKIKLYLEFDKTKYNLGVSIDNGASYVVDSHTSSTSLSSYGATKLRIGRVIGSSSARDKYIDLNSFKIYVDDQLVYQPTLRIPYTQSKTGSKIVDAVYRDRVEDVYEQFGQANYYTIEDLGGEKYNVQVVGSPTLVGGVASGFSSNNYINCLSNINLANFSITVPFILNSTSAQVSDGSLIHFVGTSGNFRNRIVYAANNTIVCSILVENDATTGRFLTLANATQLGLYLIKFEFNGTEYSLSAIFPDGTIHRATSINETNLLATNSNNTIRLGYGKTADSILTAGSIDLNAFKIYVDGKEVFRGYEKDNVTLPMGEVYGMIETAKQSGGVSSLNASFRGTYDNYNSVPTMADEYIADAKNDKTPKNNDYIVIKDCSDYDKEASETETISFETSDMSSSATITLSISGRTQTFGAVQCLNKWVEGFNGEISVNYVVPNWSIKSTKKAIYNSATYNEGDTIVSFPYNVYKNGEIKLILSSDFSGQWLFRYMGDWDTDGKDGWKSTVAIPDKSLISGLGMPSSRYIDLTLGATGSQYTAPANGYYYCYRSGGTSKHLNLNNISKGYMIQSKDDSNNSALILPVSKGDTVTVNYYDGTTQTFRFIYAEGEQ